MSHFIDIAVLEDNRMIVDSLWAWASESRGIRLKAVTSTVDELLRARRGPECVAIGHHTQRFTSAAGTPARPGS
jgi:hypothetical protein